MSVKLRLKRMGTTNRPYYRVTAVDSRRKRDGAVLEELGHYDPLAKENKATLVTERIKYWLSVGAVPTYTVASLLRRAGLKDKPGTKVSDQPATPVAPAAPAPAAPAQA